jgi:hypothetical protein
MGEVRGLYPYHAFCEGIGSQISVLLHNLCVVHKQQLSYLDENAAADTSVQ